MGGCRAAAQLPLCLTCLIRQSFQYPDSFYLARVGQICDRGNVWVQQSFGSFPGQFNEWRRDNDYPLIWDLLVASLPYFSDWMAEQKTEVL